MPLFHQARFPVSSSILILGAWGAGGGLLVEAWELYRAIRLAGGFPWQKDPEHEPHPPALLVALVLRAALAFGIALAMAVGNQISGAFAAFAAGIAAPVILDQLGRLKLGSLQ